MADSVADIVASLPIHTRTKLLQIIKSGKVNKWIFEIEELPKWREYIEKVDDRTVAKAPDIRSAGSTQRSPRSDGPFKPSGPYTASWHRKEQEGMIYKAHHAMPSDPALSWEEHRALVNASDWFDIEAQWKKHKESRSCAAGATASNQVSQNLLREPRRSMPQRPQCPRR